MQDLSKQKKDINHPEPLPLYIVYNNKIDTNGKKIGLGHRSLY